VVSPEATVWSGEAEFVVARTTEGEIGILADHEPLLAALTTGAVTWNVEHGAEQPGRRPPSGTVHGGGSCRSAGNQVTLLTDRAQIGSCSASVTWSTPAMPSHTLGCCSAVHASSTGTAVRAADWKDCDGIERSSLAPSE
jgi:hypothetical protein